MPFMPFMRLLDPAIFTASAAESPVEVFRLSDLGGVSGVAFGFDPLLDTAVGLASLRWDATRDFSEGDWTSEAGRCTTVVFAGVAAAAVIVEGSSKTVDPKLASEGGGPKGWPAAASASRAASTPDGSGSMPAG
eukprot:CAMPEP_0175066754 /NCGR_PEP_ID=MMETSP0052_2-20121109/16696_1 /TAXON_ID=51329 ORGANISM="Polytomella parva, Strain SAG 63-3" /NCGR_SAMPLE_ID=MMETSP0052_2 /ASSEMBLY_ACC=CAM_ASM_000194 /LENGTH=133 /DNA_ID=CAMNT_0016333515 /DNA_START=751 /DNA_END=1152 /DNA_ORIENTATION=-